MTDRYDHSGVLVVDKPEGPTSHGVVSVVRRAMRVKVGHTGTLDPLATGVLPLVVGQATRLARFFQGHDKAYAATITLGRATNTYDREGETTEEAPVPVLTDEEAEKILDRFRGAFEQLPPLFSAIKVKGRRLYEYARRGQDAERPPRPVVVRSFELKDRQHDRWTVRVECSAGTYVRTLAHDIGQALGCGAHVETLRRARSGPFTLDQAVQLDSPPETWRESLIPMEDLLLEFPEEPVDTGGAERIRHGNQLPASEGCGDGLRRVTSDGRLLAIARASGGWIQPEIVMSLD